MTDIKERAVYAKSPLTGTYYRVTRFERLEGDQIKALEKEPVDREDVPLNWLAALDGEEVRE